MYLDDFSVTEKYKNQGIGSNLFELAKNYSFKTGNKEIRLHVNNCNSNAVEFFSKRGFEVLEDFNDKSLLVRKYEN